jgi:aspartyl-tRNA(Asn)/glutamyl-tRNA(Gln) amidotransferase subunit A
VQWQQQRKPTPSMRFMLTSILGISRRLRNRELSPVDLAKECLAQIEKLNPALNAFITVTAESAMRQARQAESEILRGEDRGPLHGIPLGLKDLIDTAGTRTTAASALFKDRAPTQDAEVVQRLRSAGAVFLGKQNLHEFAYGGSSMISYYGEVHNPWNPAHIAGGSSGGSAAAVAAGLGFGAIGTDTAGSVREPAAQCGVVGIKPTFGRISTRGVIPLSSSLDHVGPIARTVSDVAVLLQAIAGFDREDKNSVDVRVPNDLAHLQVALTPARIGVPRKFFYEDLDSEVAAAVELALAVLKNLGCEIREINLEIPTDRTLQAAESYAIHRKFVSESPELYQPETLRRIRSGENISEAQLQAARHDLAKARSEIQNVFLNLDFLVTPAVPIPAPQLVELKQNPDLLRPRELVLLRNTRPFNVWGLPAISVPCGFTASGLPIGLQIAGPPWSEAAVLRLAYTYEQATDWHKHEPNLFALSSSRARETV